ncbi:MAG: LamG domain-containing protein, partial [Candidatus Pacearchaeota archaeon]|nr:LamG domain-containing protein [Candidatus Pacearchaeota archaeon]
YYIVGVKSGNNLSLYINGNIVNSTSGLPLIVNATPFMVGIGRNPGWDGEYFNGTIDEVRIWNRSLTADEVKQQYYSNLYKYDVDKWNLYVNETNYTSGSYSYFGCAKDSTNNENCTGIRILNVILNVAPNITNIKLNSSDGSNKTKQDLHCVFDLVDADNNTMNVSVRWYKNNVLNLTIDYNNSYSNGTRIDAVLGYGNTTKGEVWHCSVRAFDGSVYSDWINSTNISILNSLPVVTLISPGNNNQTTNRTQMFIWSGVDDDGDVLSYEFNMSLVASSTCYDGDKYVSGLSTTNYTLTSPMKCFIDKGDYYKWSVRASDGSGFGDWANYWNVSLKSLLALNLLIDKVEFGLIKYLGSNDTTNNSPLPFLLENNGNSLVNVTIKATDFWKMATNPSSYYRYKIDNSSELNSFNWAGSVTTFSNMPSITNEQRCIAYLNYSSMNNSAEIDIYVQVPSMETGGYKNSTVVFTGVFAE